MQHSSITQEKALSIGFAHLALQTAAPACSPALSPLGVPHRAPNHLVSGAANFFASLLRC